MFPKGKRLPRAAFAGLTRGKRFNSAHFSYALPHQGVGYAVVISKKAAPRSVDRHLMKRRVLAALRRLPALPPGLVIFPKASALTLTSAEILAELGAEMKRISR